MREAYYGAWMQFQTGEQAVYPGCGVGTIEAIQRLEEDESAKMYVISFPDNKTRVWVPLENASDLGLRPLMSQTKLDKALAAISKQEAPPKRQTWNRRFKRYSELLQTNDPEAIGEVIGELAAIKHAKTLSFGERRIYRKAEALFIREGALVRDTDEETFSSELESVLKKKARKLSASSKSDKKKRNK